MPPSGRFFIEEDLNVHYAVDVWGSHQGCHTVFDAGRRVFGFVKRVRAINARRAKPASKSLKRPHCTGHTLAVSDAALSADFNLQDRLTQVLVIDDRDIPELKAPCLIGNNAEYV